MDTGRSLTPHAAVVRNLIRFLDCYVPVPVAPAVFTIFFHPSNNRPGDIAAGTIVVRDRPTDWVLGGAAPATEPPATPPIETGPPELSEDEFRLLDRFLGRMNELAPDVQVRITADLVRRFVDRIPRRTADPQAYLVQVFADEQMKRRSRFAPRAQAGAAGRITVPAERFVQRQRDGWGTVRPAALRVGRSGGGREPGARGAFRATQARRRGNVPRDGSADGAIGRRRAGERRDPRVRAPIPRSRRGSRPGAHLSGRSAGDRISGARRERGAQRAVSRARPRPDAPAPLHPARFPGRRRAIVEVRRLRVPLIRGAGGDRLRHDS